MIKILRISLVIVMTSLFWFYLWGYFYHDYFLNLIIKTEAEYLNEKLGNKSIRKRLTEGSSGIEVKILQHILKKEVDQDLDITGYFGPKTKKALKIFQEKYSLEKTGIVDEMTKEKLNQIYLNQLCPIPSKTYENDFILFPVSKAENFPPTIFLPI
ncbi:MAG: peptidoglycan-binding protein [Patescibacteria group bacterium]|nr:peptidoglycan-binding protein [Patescibacteria group bacterium]